MHAMIVGFKIYEITKIPQQIFSEAITLESAYIPLKATCDSGIILRCLGYIGIPIGM